jgi:hypothetical protein
MTGLLQRLGARATGTGWAVRSDARLPFGADRLGDGDPLPAEAAMPASTQAPAPARRTFAPAVPPHAAAAPEPSQRTAPQDPTLLRALDTRAPTQTAPRMSAAPVEPDALVSPQPGQPAQSATPHDPPTGPSAHSTAAARTHAEHRLREPPPLRRSPADAVPTPLRPATRPDRANSAAASPAPYGRPQRATGMANAWPSGAPAPAEAPTEVHIHIGRIDVTALPATPAPRTARPTRTEPMSLDSYLKTRREA